MPRIVRAVVYVRPGVGPSIDEQLRVVKQAADERRWRLLDTFEENVGVGPGLDRPALHRALEALASGEAHILAVSSIDRLALSLPDLAVLIRWFEAAEGPSLVSVGPDVIKIDTSTDEGRTFATAIAYLGEWERAAASRRMREALLARRAAGGRISRPAVAEHENLTRVVKGLREQGFTLQQIADQLNEHDIPTLRGGAKWRPSSLQAVLGHQRDPPEHPQVLPPPRPNTSEP
jgi:DNA invertase Pin-like site-specific DNA recombinase